MRIISWSKRKRWNKKGFSSIVGAIFMILIVGVLASAYFMFTLAQNTVYNDAVRENNLLELNRMSESINVTSQPIYTPSTGSVRVVVNLQNDGPINVQIKTLWVQGTNNNNYGFIDGLNIYLSSGQNFTIDRAVSVLGAIATNQFYGWIITDRGRTIHLYPAHQTGPAGSQGPTGPSGQTGPVGPEGPPSTSALIAQGIGSIALDFANFRYYTYATGTRLANFPTGVKSFNVPGNGVAIAFGANLTNLDPRQKAITLNLFSNIWILFPGSPGQSVRFHIVNYAADGTLSSYSNPITIAYGETKFIIFASLKEVPFSQSSISPSLTPNSGAVNLLLLGTIGAEDYGQNIPFVAVRAT